MRDNAYWENGERVQISSPRYEKKGTPKIDSPELVMLRNMMGLLLQPRHAELTIECLSLVSGLGYQGNSMTEIARKYQVSRATVSRRCVDLCKKLGIPPTRAMRNESGQSNCRKAAIKRQEELIGKYL